MDSIRVWLEPDYDHGRTGAWLLDWPGAFTWGTTRDIALARAPSAAHRFVDWLAEHGDAASAVPAAHTVVIEEVTAYRLADGYEVNATFGADEEPVAPAELDAAIRRLGYARDDLLELVLRITGFEARGGQLPTEERTAEATASGASDGRHVDDVLRHVAGAETWFVSRLDPSARYEGPRDDLTEYLTASRAFLVAGLRRMHAEGASPRDDGKGEHWTLAKLLRRALYHSLDHLDELDRRLARADGSVERVEIKRNADFDLGELRRLWVSAGLARRARDSDELMRRALAGSTETVSAWDDGSLVGFGRLIGDDATNAYISTVAVAPRWQDRGLGTRLMRALMEGCDEQKLLLEVRRGAEEFYERLGFEPATSAFVRPRSNR